VNCWRCSGPQSNSPISTFPRDTHYTRPGLSGNSAQVLFFYSWMQANPGEGFPGTWVDRNPRLTGRIVEPLLKGTHRDSDHAFPLSCTPPREWRTGWISTILTCRVSYYCRRSGLLNMGLLADFILINSYFMDLEHNVRPPWLYFSFFFLKILDLLS